MTTKKERIMKNIEADKSLKINNGYDKELFYEDAKRWLSAIKENRMLCNIVSVSASGMSRQMKFLECKKGKKQYNYMQFFVFLRTMGERMNNKNDCVVVNGCGMDMVFATNYNIIRKLFRLGFISKKQSEILCQKTPTTI